MKIRTRSQRLVNMRRKISRFARDYANDFGTEPSKCEICQHFGVSWEFLSTLMGPEFLSGAPNPQGLLVRRTYEKVVKGDE